MTIDLSGLSKGFSELLRTESPVTESITSGAPLELSLDDILEDHDQPRKAFDAAKLDDLAHSIRADRVRVPISVRSANAEGKYIINHGARRYRASILAGKTTIPAFIDDNHDDFAQVVENIQRDALTPLEIAHFIAKRREAGDKDKVIAERLGKNKTFISFHAALLAWPDYIEALYEGELCQDVQALYGLIQLNKSAPIDVKRWCQRNLPVSRRDVVSLEQQIASGSGSNYCGESSAKANASVSNIARPQQNSTPANGEGLARRTSPLKKRKVNFSDAQRVVEIAADASDAEILDMMKKALSMSDGMPFWVQPIVKRS